MRTPVDVRFEKGDPVREYWLARGEGFAVETRRGRVVGEVVDVVIDPQRQRVMTLVVQKAHRLSELPAEQIQAVVPARDAFVLDGRRSLAREREDTAGLGQRVARFRAWAATGLRRADTLLRRAVRATGSWAAPRFRRAGLLARDAARSVAAWTLGLVRLLAGELQQRRR